MEFRYMGFEQRDNTRAYRFDGIAKGERTAHFIITADLALFLKHRVGIQEGPTLCAHKLAEAVEAANAVEHHLTEADLVAYTTARDLSAARKAEMRGRSGHKRTPHPAM